MAAENPTGSTADALPTTLEGLFVALETPLLLYAMKLVKDREVAEDLVQEAFVRLHPRMSEVEQPRAWLYRTVHNQAMNYHRSRRKVVSFEDASPSGEYGQDDYEPRPDDHTERLEAIGLARAHLENLQPKYRDVLVYKFDHDLSYKEISEKTGLSISNVGYILHHGIKALAYELEKAGVTP